MKTTFTDLGLIAPLLEALAKQGYQHPTPIQEQAIPVILSGNDVFGCAQTGTGKTAAFSLPILQTLSQNTGTAKPGSIRPIRALILTPTRELAIQIGENITEYGTYTKLKHTVIFGGVSQVPQVKALRSGVDIVVATPGRLLDLLNQKIITLGQVQIFTLDEADRMLDMGFIHDIRRIIPHLPMRRQNLFFSATMAPTIMELANTILKDPTHIEVTPNSSTVETIDQSLYTVTKEHKRELLLHLLRDPAIKNAIVFSKTKHGANKIEKILAQANIPSAAIHGNKSQTARQTALAKLKNGQIRVLVATDIAARGIDVDLLSHVIIYDVPLEPESYVHRIGRTGRAQATGQAIMFCEPEELKYLQQVLKLIGQEIPLVTDHPYHHKISLTARPSSIPKPAKPDRGPRPNNHGRPSRDDRPPQSPTRYDAPRDDRNHKAKPHRGAPSTAKPSSPSKSGRYY